MSRKAGKRLAVGQNSGAAVAEDIPFIDTDQRIHEGGIFGMARLEGLLVRSGGSGEEDVKGICSECQRKHRTSAYRGGRVPPADKVIHIEGCEV